jgi:hypothetical protein
MIALMQAASTQGFGNLSTPANLALQILPRALTSSRHSLASSMARLKSLK